MGGGGGEGGAEGRQALSLFARRRNQQQQQDNGLSPPRLLTGTGLFPTHWNTRYGGRGGGKRRTEPRMVSVQNKIQTCARNVPFVCERREAAGRKRRSAAQRSRQTPSSRACRPPASGSEPAGDTLQHTHSCSRPLSLSVCVTTVGRSGDKNTSGMRESCFLP